MFLLNIAMGLLGNIGTIFEVAILPLKVLWWIVKTIFGIGRKKKRRPFNRRKGRR